MTSPIDVAYVEVRPDVDDFDRALNKELDTTFRKMEERALKSTQKVEQRFDELQTEVHENFKEIDKNSTQVFENFQKVVEKTNVQVVQEFKQTGDRINESLHTGIADGFDNQLNVVHQRVVETNKNIEDSTKRSVDHVNKDLDRIGEDTDRNLRDRRGNIITTLGSIGSRGADSFGSALTSTLSGIMQPSVFKAIFAIALVPALLALAPQIAATISSLIALAVPFGFIGIALISQFNDPKLKRAASTFGNFVKKIFDDLTEGFVDDFIKALEIFGQTLVKITPSLERIFEKLEPLIIPLAEGIAGFVEKLIPGLETTIENIGPAVEEFAANLPKLGEEIGEFFATISEDSDGMVRGISAFFTIVFFLLDLISGALKVVSDAFDDVNKGLEYLALYAHAVFNILTGDWASAGDQINEIGDRIFKGLERALGGFIKAASGAFNNFWGKVGSVFSAIAGAWSRSLTLMVNAALYLINKIIGIFRGFGKTIQNFFSGSLLYNAGKNLIQGLINGVYDKLGSLRSAFSYVTSLIPSWKGPEEKDRKLLQPAGRAIMEGLNVGIEDGLPNLHRTLGDVTNSIGLSSSANFMGGINVNLNFHGAVPTEDQARRAGVAAGQGLRDSLAKRAVRTAVRMI